jgi:hypothetical protein
VCVRRRFSTTSGIITSDSSVADFVRSPGSFFVCFSFVVVAQKAKENYLMDFHGVNSVQLKTPFEILVQHNISNL